jgi:hypothetical protein
MRTFTLEEIRNLTPAEIALLTPEELAAIRLIVEQQIQDLTNQQNEILARPVFDYRPQSIWPPERVRLTVLNIPFDIIEVEYRDLETDELIDNESIQFVSFVNGIYYIAPPITSRVIINIFGASLQTSLSVTFRVNVGANFISVLPAPRRSQPDRKFIHSRIASGNHDLIGYEGFRCNFVIRESTLDANGDPVEVFFITDQPRNQAQAHTWPGYTANEIDPPGSVPGNHQFEDTDSQGRRRYRLLNHTSNPHEFYWIFPRSNTDAGGATYDVQFSVRRPTGGDSNTWPAPATQSFRVYSLNPNDPTQRIAELDYTWEINGNELIVTFNEPDQPDRTSGLTLAIDWGDGSGILRRSLTGARVETERHWYADSTPRMVIITVTGALGTVARGTFFAIGFASIFTVRIDESRSYDSKDLVRDAMGGNGLDYPDIPDNVARQSLSITSVITNPVTEEQTIQYLNPGALDSFYPFDSIDPVLLNGLNFTHYLRRNNWRIGHGNETVSDEVFEDHNVMIEIPPFWYKVERGTVRQGREVRDPETNELQRVVINPNIIDVSICGDHPKINRPVIENGQPVLDSNGNPVMERVPDDTWTSVFPDRKTCLYIAAFPKSEGDDRVSILGDEIQISKDIEDMESRFYDLVDYRAWTALQSLFLVRHRTLHSTGVWAGLNPNVVTGQNNPTNITAMNSPMTGTDNRTRFLGLDNFWGLRPTRVDGIKYENNSFVIEGNHWDIEKEKRAQGYYELDPVTGAAARAQIQQDSEDKFRTFHPLAPNTHINRPIITGVVGNNDGGFLPVRYEGFPQERYRDVVRLNGTEDVFVGIATHLATATGFDFDDNGIFAIGNRTLSKDGDFKEYFIERYKVKYSMLQHINNEFVREGTPRQVPLNCIFIQGPSTGIGGTGLAPFTLTFTIEGSQAYRYVVWDRLLGASDEIRPDTDLNITQGASSIQYNVASNTMVISRTYNAAQIFPNNVLPFPYTFSGDINDPAEPLAITVFAVDKLWNVHHEYVAKFWVLDLARVITITRTDVTIDDPIRVIATHLDGNRNGYGWLAHSVTVDWGTTWPEHITDEQKTSGTVPGRIGRIFEPGPNVRETRTSDDAGGAWVFTHTYRDDGEHNFTEDASFFITVTVNGSVRNDSDGTTTVFSNGGVLRRQIFVYGLQAWYQFPSIAGYCQERLPTGEILNSGFPRTINGNYQHLVSFTNSAGQSMQFDSDWSMWLNQHEKFKMLNRHLLPIRWDINGDLDERQHIDEWMRLDSPLHLPNRLREKDSAGNRILGIDGRDLGEPIEIERSYFLGGNNPDWGSVAHSYTHPGVYYPRFRFMGFTPNVHLDARMRVVALELGESLPNVQNIDWRRRGDSSGRPDSLDYQTLEILLPPLDLDHPYARRVFIDWGDGTTVRFNPTFEQLRVPPIHSTVKLFIAEEHDPARAGAGLANDSPAGAIGATITITTIGETTETYQDDYEFQFVDRNNMFSMQHFANWINATAGPNNTGPRLRFHNVTADQPRAGDEMRSGMRDIRFGSSIRLRAVDRGEITIVVNIEWHGNVTNVVNYKDFVSFDRYSTHILERGGPGVVARAVMFPPQHRYRWRGIFTVTITAEGDYGLEDKMSFTFNSYPTYGFAVLDGGPAIAMGLDAANVYRLYDAGHPRLNRLPQDGGTLFGPDNERQTEWDNEWMFNKTRAVMFSPHMPTTHPRYDKEYPGVLYEINPNNFDEALDDDAPEDFYRYVRGSYFSDIEATREAMHRTRIVQAQAAAGLPPLSAGELEAAIGIAMVEEVQRGGRLDRGRWLDDFAGDVMIEVPNMWFNFYRAEIELPKEDTGWRHVRRFIYNNVHNMPWGQERPNTNCLIVETSDRRLDRDWSGTCINNDGHVTSRSYISAYHGSYMDMFQGMRSISHQMPTFWDFTTLKEEANKSGYDLLRWNHVTHLQLLLALRFRALRQAFWPQNPNVRNPTLQNATHEAGLFSRVGGGAPAGAYKFCGIFVPAAAMAGSWIEDITVVRDGETSRRVINHDRYLDPPSRLEFLDRHNPCFMDATYADGRFTSEVCGRLPVLMHHAWTTNNGVVSRVPLTGWHVRNGQAAEWEIKRRHFEGHINSSFFLPRFWSESTIRGVIESLDENGHTVYDLNIRKRWRLRARSYMGDNAWGFHATADTLALGSPPGASGHDPDLGAIFFKWGSASVQNRSPNFFSGINAVNSGAARPDATQGAQGDYALLTYNDCGTPMGSAIQARRVFDFIVVPISQWLDVDNPQPNHFSINIPTEFMDERGNMIPNGFEVPELDDEGNIIIRDRVRFVYTNDDIDDGDDGEGLTLAQAQAGREHTFNLPGRYWTHAVVVDYWNNKVEDQTEAVEVFGINVQVVMNKVQPEDSFYNPNLLKYKTLDRRLETFYCQLSYGHRIEVDYGYSSSQKATLGAQLNELQATYDALADKNTVAAFAMLGDIIRLRQAVHGISMLPDIDTDDPTANWLFTHRFLVGEYTTVFRVWQQKTYYSSEIDDLRALLVTGDRPMGWLNGSVVTLSQLIGQLDAIIQREAWLFVQINDVLSVAKETLEMQLLADFGYQYQPGQQPPPAAPQAAKDLWLEIIDLEQEYERLSLEWHNMRLEVTIDHESRTLEVPIVVEPLVAAITMEVADEYRYDLVPGDPDFDASLVDAVAVGSPILFKMTGSSEPPAIIRFYPNGIIDNNQDTPGSFRVLETPYQTIEAYQELEPAEKRPVVRVYSDAHFRHVFAEAILPATLRGVDGNGQFKVYAHQPIASITRARQPAGEGVWLLPNTDKEIEQRFWNSEAIEFDISESRYFMTIMAQAFHESNPTPILIPIPWIQGERPPTSFVFPHTSIQQRGTLGVGRWTINIYVTGYFDELGPEDATLENRRLDQIIIDIAPHTIWLRAYHANSVKDEHGELIPELLTLDMNETVDPPVPISPQESIVSGMVPLKVLFVSPQTTTNSVTINYGDGSPFRVVHRTTEVVTDPVTGLIVSGPNFEHERIYTAFTAFGFSPTATIVTNPNIPPPNTMSSTGIPLGGGVSLRVSNVTINTEASRLEGEVEGFDIQFPTGVDFAPRTVSISVRSNASYLVFDFDANAIHNDSNPWNYDTIPPRVNDPDTDSVYYVPHSGNINDIVTQTHTYQRLATQNPGEIVTYMARVATNRNNTASDVQRQAGGIGVRAIEVGDNENFVGFPPQHITIDQTGSFGIWIELVPGDWRTVHALVPGWDTLTSEERGAEITTLWNQGIKIVSFAVIDETIDGMTRTRLATEEEMDDNHPGIYIKDDCIIYFRRANQPWIFNVTYEEIGLWRYTTFVYDNSNNGRIPPYWWSCQLGLDLTWCPPAWEP